MKKTIILFIATILLLGFNQVNAQEQRRANNHGNAFISEFHIGSKPINANINNLASLGKKITKQSLDSIIIDSLSTANNTYKNKFKLLYSYDFNGRLLTSNYIDWNDTFSRWQPKYRLNYAYNTQGYRTLSENYSDWNTATNQWNIAYKKEYTFDSIGNETSVTFYDWDKTTQTFSVISKSKTNYDLNSNGTPSISYDSIYDKLINEYYLGTKSEYTYDANGKLLIQLTSLFKNGNWIPSSKEEYAYDANGNTTSLINNYYNTQTSNWVYVRKEINTFDVNNNITSKSFAEWNNTTNVWENNFKSEYTFDNEGNLNNRLFLNWDKNTNRWVNEWKSQYNFNNNYDAKDIVWDFLIFKHMVIGGTLQTWVNNTWVNNERSTYYYSANNFNGINENVLTNTNIFPNPTSGLITIAASKGLETINVFDVSGKLVYSLKKSTKQNNVELDLSALNNGIYFIHAQTNNGGVSISKVIVSK